KSHGPLTLTSLTLSKAASAVSTSGPNCGLVAALLTRMSRRPKASIVCATARSMSSARPAWAGAAMAVPPPAVISSTTAWQASGLREQTATWPPAWAKARAMARPMPRLPPVTRAARPCREKRSSTDTVTTILAGGGFSGLGHDNSARAHASASPPAPPCPAPPARRGGRARLRPGRRGLAVRGRAAGAAGVHLVGADPALHPAAPDQQPEDTPAPHQQPGRSHAERLRRRRRPAAAELLDRK